MCFGDRTDRFSEGPNAGMIKEVHHPELLEF